jgi:hypothetical protein
MVLFYGWWLWLSSGGAPRQALVGLTFNSMLDHLLNGRFDVDPRLIGDEGFLHNGRVYAYWGIWCALLRLPLWLFHRLDVDMTAFSCLAANTIAVSARIRAVLLIREQAPLNRTSKAATDLMLAYVVIGGSATSYLRTSIFQEVVFWAIAFASIFVYFAIKGLVTRHFSAGSLCSMALCAGLALLTRVPTGIGLILALASLLAVLGAQSLSRRTAGSPLLRRRVRTLLDRRLLDRRLLAPAGILALCIALTGAVNYMRWGNPLTFADFHLYLGNVEWPDRVQRFATYGNFNIGRIPIALLYYFVPLWVVPTPGGSFLFEKAQLRLFDVIELPPSTFLLTDLVAIAFILLFVVTLRKRRGHPILNLPQCAAIAAGLLVPCLLMLTFISLTFRYRMEFYPEFDFLAFLGLYLVLADQDAGARFERRRVWMNVALAVTLLAGFVALQLYLNAPFGPAIALLRRGVIKGLFLPWS